MKKYIILLVLFPCIAFSQSIVGVWTKSPQSKTAIEFTKDGQLNFLNLITLESINKKLKATYKLESENGITYYIETIFMSGTMVSTKKIKYKFKDGKLYLPSESETDGTVTVNEYKDEYTRIK
ncbi:hypothetical protein Q765_09700 [Flavobacterium rivuli WB 3.3-2 = DSM 21788]|uniref:DUF5640 domain-containing protein n=1 Tax=Flavobacterium rivuli WB 3.3-2 = DSM 21788 TaxID=1121895 RepID=A0A0A2M5Z6_9FLAO|nr:hypothetical protein [Flavobacterium rivuli]KGO86883.1 hypothetical protein Q765_09700 [Flavobacterium rivuli WB 3.3-2 = DSM 21788]